MLFQGGNVLGSDSQNRKAPGSTPHNQDQPTHYTMFRGAKAQVSQWPTAVGRVNTGREAHAHRPPGVCPTAVGHQLTLLYKAPRGTLRATSARYSPRHNPQIGTGGKV